MTTVTVCAHVARFSLRLLSLGALLLIGACDKPPAPAVKGPAEVTVMTVTPRDAPISFEFVGQTQSSREVEIRARVDGFLERRLYTEGDQVQPNQPLFQMDRKPFEAALQSARGQLAQQQAALQVAQETLNRVKPLADQNALSKKDLDDAVGNVDKAKASVFAAQGQVQTADLNLGYTTIHSPLKGLSSFAKVQDGAYLSSTNSLLTSVAQLDPMWVNFSISENETLRYRDESQRGLLKLPSGDNFEVEVVLADGTIFPNRGRISFADPSYSKETGTFLVRAVLANSRGQLRPGQFVRVQVYGASRPNAILIPQRAVQQGAKSHFVWVVNKESKAEQRVVDVGAWDGDNWFINQGLLPGEEIVVDGALRVANGAPLKTSPYTPTVAAAAPAPAQAASSLGFGSGAMGKPVSTPAEVFFEPGSAMLNKEATAALATVAKRLAANASTRIDVLGYVDKTGTAAQNAELAKNRALAVRDSIIRQGARPEQIHLRIPVQVTGGDATDKARRVEIRDALATDKRRPAADSTALEKEQFTDTQKR
jgi:membrane fusion protein (multidrug efflux system)